MFFANFKRMTPDKVTKKSQSTPEVIQLAELDICIIRSARKSISLHIKPEGIILRAPMRSPTLALKAFALTKIEWLRKHAYRVQSQQINRDYADGEMWLLFGQEITLRIHNGKLSHTYFNENIKELHVIAGPKVKKRQKFVKQQVNSWYKQTAMDYLNSQIPDIAKGMQLDYTHIQVRDYKARWGSCSSNGKLSFNWRIFMAPCEVIDSVIVHELAHTRHFNHSKHFWKLVYSTCPDYKKQHAWLKEHQYFLQA